MTANALGAAIALDPHPAPLRGGAAGGVDDLHRLEAVPAVALWHRLAPGAREEVARLVDVHVVELAAERVDLPSARLPVEHAALVLESAPPDHAVLAHQLR